VAGPVFETRAHSRRPTVVPAIGGFTGNLPPFDAPADRKGNILHLLAAGEDRAVQTAICEWFSADPVAARDWLASQPSLESFQPALSQIATNIAESGSPVEALQWAELLDEGPARERTVFEIYALGRRYHWLSDEQIRSAPFPPERVETLLSGAADD
jgi:hypothetical protein